MDSTKEQTKIKIHGITFPWNAILSKKERHDENIERIRRCEQDSLTIKNKKLGNSFMLNLENSFKENTNISLFVHHSQFMFFPACCILCDRSTPSEFHLIEELPINISFKFSNTNFENILLWENFIELLYSEENQKRLEKIGLHIDDLDRYFY